MKPTDRVALYARVSTQDQTCENQLLELRRYAEARGWQSVEYVDHAISGAKDRRPALDQLTADVRRHKVSTVVCWRLDRLGRNLRHLVLLLDEWQARGVAFVTLGEGIDTMQRYGISQLPVVRDSECESLADVIGSLQDRALLERVFTHPDVLHEDVANAMQPPLGAIEASATLDEIFSTLTGGTNAVVVAREGKPVGVLTRSDLLDYLAHSR